MTEPNTKYDDNKTDELSKWNLLQLEIKEILSECYFPTSNNTDSSSTSKTSTSNYKTLLNVQEYIETIKNILDKLPSHKSLATISTNNIEGSNTSYLKSDLYKKYKTKWDPVYKKTMYEGIEIIGSYSNNTMTTSSGNGTTIPTIDMVFMLNNTFWQSQDYLNHRYYDKRNLMILHIGQFLSKKKFIDRIGDNVRLSYYRNDLRKLVLLISPKKMKFQIRILVGGKSFPFSYTRLFPNCNNLKQKDKATLIYNHGIIEDFSFLNNQKTLTETIVSEITNFEESLVLLKVWSSIHGLRNAYDGLGSFELTMIMVYCYRTKKISRGMTVLQVFTTILHFMKELFSNDKYIIMPSSNECNQEVIYQKEHKNSTLLQGYIDNSSSTTIPIFLNEQRTMNIFTRLSATSCRLIHHHLMHTCNTKSSWNVQTLFLQPKRFWNLYDVYLQIPRFHYKDNQDNGFIPYNNIDIGNKEEYTVQCICYILHHALYDRCDLIRPYTSGNGMQSDDLHTWSFNNKPSCTNQYIIGIKFANNEALTRMVDKCIEVKKKLLFTFIFGDKVELRRFRDGTIYPSVLWNSSDRYLGIIQDILNHIFTLHFSQSRCTLYYSNIVSLIEGPSSTTNNNYDSMTLFKNIIHAYNSLSLLLMNHHNNNNENLVMPLSIDSVTTTSPMLRYSSLFPLLPHFQLGSGNKGYYDYSVIAQEPIVIYISFEKGCKKWPRDVNAIKAAKCAMLIALANTIEYIRDDTQDVDYQYFQGDINVSSHPYVDLGYKGYSWRIKLLANEELKVLSQLKVPTSNAIQLYQKLYIENKVDPIHHSTIHTLHTKYPSASGTVRLVQRWLAGHLLSDNIFPLNVLELLVSYVYIHYSNALHSIPNTPILGFIRFLQFISTFDFQYSPLLINFNQQEHDDELNCKEIWDYKEKQHLTKIFKSVRGDDYTLGPPCYIVTSMEYTLLHNDSTLQSNYNNSFNNDWLLSSVHTTNHNVIERIVWNRFVELSKRCYNFIMNPLTNHHKASKTNLPSSVLPIFQESGASLQKYHVLIRINTNLIYNTSCSSTVLSSKNETSTLDDLYSFTNGMNAVMLGPKLWRKKCIKYKNLNNDNTNELANKTIHGWEPIKEFVTYLQSKYNQYCIFFYNQYTPHVIGILFRPTIASSVPSNISAINCNYKRPYYNITSTDSNDNPTSAVYNLNDIIREIRCIGEDIIQDVKIMIDLPDCKIQKVSDDGDSSSSSGSTNSTSSSTDNDSDNE